MSDWLYEAGIGEARAARVEHGQIVEALIEVEGPGPRPGAVVEGRLSAIALAGRRGFVTLDDAREVLVEPLPREWTQGGRVRVAIVREAIAEHDRTKRAKGRPAAGTPLGCGPDLRARLNSASVAVRCLEPRDPDLLEQAGWSEFVEAAAAGRWRFAGGELRISPTPAMTLIDVDGHLEATSLAIAAATASAQAIIGYGIAGSVGIDFPTLGGKDVRAAVASAFDIAMVAPFERTAVNGFGFMQVIRPRTHASLIELLQADPAGHAARALLRRIERETRSGAAVIVAHPSVIAVIERHPAWLDRLARQRGGAIGLRGDAAIAMSAGHAEPA